jgi:hypothetical protein
VRAAIEAIEATEAVWGVPSSARVDLSDPVFHVVAHPDRPHEAPATEAYRRAQFQAWDMLSGRRHPVLGEHPKYLDVIGVDYYPWNQWVYNGPTADGTTIGPDDPGYRPLRLILGEIASRYGRLLFIAETGIEGDARAGWLQSVGREARAAILGGVPVQGICLYPIVNFLGWDDDRHCRNGLWDYADEAGGRAANELLANELRRQIHRFRRLRRQIHRFRRLGRGVSPDQV